MQRETKRQCLSLMLAVILASLMLSVFAVAATAQEVKADNQQKAAESAEAIQPPQEESAAINPPEIKEKTSYFGPAKLSWDTTVKYSNMFRVAERSAVLTSPVLNESNVNQDDGDNNFHRGLVQNRIDFLTEADLSFGKNFGFRGSAAAWWSPTYNQRTANTSPFTYNSVSANYRHFPEATKDLQFLQAELLDAFVHASFQIGNSNLSFRGGQYTQTWGQTLFFGRNGIAGAMAPVDLVKALSVPNVQFKELMRPVPQVGFNLQINRKVSIGAYYQYMWKANRMMSVGSYFGNGDIMGDGAERFAFGQDTWLYRRPDVDAKNAGQFGVQLQISAPHGWDLGFYGVQFHEKAPSIYVAPQICFGPPGTPACPFNLDPAYFDPTIGKFGSYGLAYHQNIKAFGMSASKTVGNFNYAAEVSGRVNQDLAGAIPIVFAPPVAWSNNKGALYPVGNTLHANFSALATLRPNFIAKDNSLVAEVAWNNLLSVTKNNGWWTVPFASGNCGTTTSVSQTDKAICNTATKNAMIFQVVYTPTYHQALPGVDLLVPVGFNFSPYGRSVLGPGFNTHHGGFFNIGAEVRYRDSNRFTVTYQRFLGEQIGSVDQSNLLSYGQSFGDRNYISFSIYRTFGLRASQKAK